jgi:hypothetical protein
MEQDMKKIVLASAFASALALGYGAVPALAHDEYGNPNYSHEEDHAEHRDYHEDQREEHRRAHEEGFASEAEHRAYHRYLREQHEEFHENHPGTWHDHYWWWYHRHHDYD